MADPKKRDAGEAFVEYDSNVHRSKRRRVRKRKSGQDAKDEDMVDAPPAPVIEASKTDAFTDQKEDALKASTSKIEDTNLSALALVPVPTPEELAALGRKRNKKRNKDKGKVKLQVDHIGSHAVVKADAKKSPKKKKTPRWKLSQPAGGVFIDQDPILADRDRYLVLPTAASIQIYATRTSLLIRSLHTSENERVVNCLIDPSSPENLFISMHSGTVQKWDWVTGKKLEQWRCQRDLQRIIALLADPVNPGHYVLLIAHGSDGEKSRLLRSVLVPNSSTPSEEVLLRSKTSHWSVCKSIDNGNVVLLCSGKQLTIGQLLPKAKGSEEMGYTWREVTLPQPVSSMDVKIQDRPKTAGSSPVRVIDVVVGCTDGVILIYEDLLYRLIGREKDIKDIEILSRRLHWHRQSVNTVKWSRDGNYIVSGGHETVLVIWQLDTNQQQFLPHISTSILNLTISIPGSSYALRLADNSIMILSTADLLPSANISGLALAQHVEKPVAAALNPQNPYQLLLAIRADPLRKAKPSANMLQTFNTHTARQDARQALAWNMTTAIKAGPDGDKVIEPSVTHLRITHDGQWLVTLDKWHPKPRDLEAIHTVQHGQRDRFQSYEICLRFWKWQEASATWELVTRVDEPHSPVSNSVLDLAVNPTKLEASTIGQDGALRIWSPMARHRDGVAVKDKTGQPLYTWMCSRSAQLEPEPAATNVAGETSGALAYSEDGSVIAASWTWSAEPKRVVHFVNSRTAQLSLTQANIVSPGPAHLAFSGRYLLALSHKFCVWDTVALRKTYSITLRHNARDGKYLAVNTHDRTFALAFDSRQPMVPSDVAIFDTRDPYKGPLHQGKIHGNVRVLLSNMKQSGYLTIDSDARIRHLTPPDAVRSVSSVAVGEAGASTKGLKDIFGTRAAVTAGNADSETLAATTTLVASNGNTEPKSLESVLSSFATSKLPSVRQMFDQVASLFARKPAEAA